MMLEITDAQARDMAWCLLASIDAALKLGLEEMAEERMTLLRKIAPAQAEMLGVPEPAIPTSWLLKVIMVPDVMRGNARKEHAP